MKIDLNKVVSINDLWNEYGITTTKLKAEDELFVFDKNRPAFVILSMRQYENLHKMAQKSKKKST